MRGNQTSTAICLNLAMLSRPTSRPVPSLNNARRTPVLLACLCAMSVLSSCAAAKTTAKVAVMPVKATYYAGKGVYLTGKGIYKVGEGVYKVGSIPVKITSAALDTTSDVLVMTLLVVNTAGAITEVSRDIQTLQLNAELQALRGARNILEVLISEPI